MDNKKLSLKTTMISFLVSAAFILSVSIAYAGESCQLIRITKDKAGGGSSVQIFPEKITVPVGTCTVWINFIRGGKVNVSFRENAKQCILSTDAATGFEKIKLETGESCYYSEPLSLGKSASLYWTKPGIYKYTIEAPKGTATSTQNYSGNIIGEGVIEVK